MQELLLSNQDFAPLAVRNLSQELGKAKELRIRAAHLTGSSGRRIAAAEPDRYTLFPSVITNSQSIPPLQSR